MPYDTLSVLLPLIGGYWIITRSIFYRDYYRRISSQKLIFDSVFSGILLFGATCFIRWIVSFCPCLYGFVWDIIESSPYYVDLFGTSIFSFIFALLFTYCPNYIYGKLPKMIKSYLFYKTISRQGNELEQFLLEAFILSKFVQLTLKNNKVYVGFVVELRGPKENNYVKILPVISGYRDSLNKILRFTTPYFEAIKFFNKDKNSDAGDLRMIIKQNEILTASFFDPKIYHKMNPPISAQQSR